MTIQPVPPAALPWSRLSWLVSVVRIRMGRELCCPVAVQAGAVERVSTNALLLLVSAAETARRHHFDFTIETPSAAMSAAIERLGLEAQFSGMMRQ